ncbi:MAG: sodium:solute symporter [Elusimicrobiales bacterium]|nr:sodium:solute symporter [Elusimicrobiales bacterium]MCK5582574.1 sodium:solute symporter [Elusimicrobiales bacterium]
MNGLDWFIFIGYMVGMVALAVYLGKSQKNEKDYYVGGNDINYWAIGISTMATQCSTNSLLGAPAFVISVGGLLWLQYELAVPLAMIAVMVLLIPFFRKQSIISVYEYLEKRFGPGTRTLLSVLFQFLRAFSTGVTVYGISIVLQHIIGIPFWIAVLCLGIITVIYDFFGGMKAVVYSDVIQMIILYTGIIFCLYFAISLVGGWSEMWRLFPSDMAKTIDLTGHGFGDGKTFAFWPMLFGGLFLYVSYYGCDQTQVQRELSSKSLDDTNMSLFINGIFRFPLVITYCFVGVAIGAYIIKNPAFLNLLTDSSTGAVNYNLAVPVFVLEYLPHGVIGLIIVALFAAAMSSLDSTINSLSAVTVRDIIERFWIKGSLDEKRQLLWSRLTTVFWGGMCITFSFFVGNISNSIIESINKIGSLANGPILATFLLAILTRRATGTGTVIGILAGFCANLYLWIAHPEISWLWWNVSGCFITFTVGYYASIIFNLEFNFSGSAGQFIRYSAEGENKNIDHLLWSSNAKKQFNYKKNWPKYYAILAGYFVLMVIVLKIIEGFSK